LITILHLSDLHRSHNEPIDNDTLLSSLLADRDRYLIDTPAIRAPDFAVVSGDIIQGVRLGDEDFEVELEKQYNVAADFLGRLADHFFNGDRSKIAIVPGNHDVCWNTAISTMICLDTDAEPKEIGPHLFGPESPYRWSWSERRIYRISSLEQYEKRLSPYWKFIEKFYDGINLAHKINPRSPFNFFEFDAGRILLAAFSSVHGNDCFCNHGAIQGGAIGTCALNIRGMARQPVLRIAAWHHSLQGPPQRDDYMDPFVVHEMIGTGFRLGLHGHQHQADASAYNIHLPEAQSMAIVSAGSLCAGANELPRGTNRQYNLIEISDDYGKARVHVREMVQGNQFGRCRQGLFGPDGFVDMLWEDATRDGNRLASNLENFDTQTVVVAEDALRSGDWRRAFELLSTVQKMQNSHARRLFLEAALHLEKWDAILSLLDPPCGVEEFLLLLRAHEGRGQLRLAIRIIENSAKDFGVDAATIAAQINRFELRLALGK
jgi:hypothetical protein